MQTTTAKPHTLLLVDDQPSVRLTLAYALRKKYTVRLANSSAEALEVFRANPDIDLVITDLSMPGVTGLELCRALRQVRARLPIIVMSGVVGVQDGVEATQAMGDGWRFLHKPFHMDELHAMIVSLLQGNGVTPVQNPLTP